MSIRTILGGLALVTAFAVIAGGTAARSELRNEPAIREGLIAAGIAYEIGRVCGPIEVRMLRGVAYLQSIETEARTLGYSRDEIAAYTGDSAEKDRLEALARQRLRDMGAIEGQPQSYCTVGRAEIAAGSTVGRLLR